MRRAAHLIPFLGIFLISIFGVAPSWAIASSSWAIHIVISEVKIAGTTATDEFVELYNPTNQPIDLSTYKLKKKTASGTESNLLTTFPATSSIPAYGFYLIAHQTGYTNLVAPDARYSSSSYSLADNNTVLLYDGATLIDKVGWGAATDFEGTVLGSPGTQSLIRLPNDGYGYGQDTDNNFTDFALLASNPQNSSSNAENPRPEPNNAPELTWEGSAGFVSDGVSPDSGDLGQFEFRVKYSDSDNDAPNQILLWFDSNRDGLFSAGEEYAMQETDLLDLNFADGKNYSKTLTIASAGTYKYKFSATDAHGAFASGNPTFDQSGPTVTEANVAPVVDFAGILDGDLFFGSKTISWTSSDLNAGQTLKYALYYSAAGQNNYQLIAQNLTGNTYSWDTSAILNGQYNLKIVATDNGSPVLTGEAESPDFYVQNLAGGEVVINEVSYDPPQTGTDSKYEWVELYNMTSSEIRIYSWQICDLTECDTVPDVVLPAYAYVVIAADQTGFLENFPDYDGTILSISDTTIGNGLSNGGDTLRLKTGGGTVISECSWNTAPDNNESLGRQF